MSGIFGVTYRNPDPDVLADALDGLSYWNKIYGSAADDTMLLERTGFGCRMEHFSDAFAHGDPIQHISDEFAVVDALLYNREELFTLLSPPPEQTISDEELLLVLINRFGFEILKEVNGDFAGAVYVPGRLEWIVFRDHMGVRPLFFYSSRDLFAFSTDIRGLAAVPGVDMAVNEMMLYQRMTGTGGMTIRDTEFQHIHCIMPGSYVRFTMNEQDILREEHVYWRINSRKIRLPNDEAYRNELRRLVTDAVHRRCDAITGLLGAELSGGLDSSVIDILINRHGRKAVYFSWSADPAKVPLKEEDERIVIQDICDQEGISCRYLSRSDSFGYDYIRAQMMPPYIDTPPLGYGSAWMRAQGARVVFSGHGGDEGVSHRAGWLELLYHGEWLSYFKICLDETRGMNLHLLRAVKVGIDVALRKWKSFNGKPTYEDLHPKIFAPEFTERMLRDFRFQPIQFSYLPVRYINDGGTRSRLDNAAFLGAFCGVRYLFPFVDHRVIDFAVSIPRRLHVNHRASRLIFRETFADLMPESLQRVNYKDTPSMRTRDVPAEKNAVFHIHTEKILSELDPALWGGILDLDGIASWSKDNITTFQEQYRLMYMMNRLNGLLLIQTIIKDARNWRNRHE